MHYLTIVLRLLHVVGGAFWFGSAMMVGFMITPTVAATGEAGQKFMAGLVQKANLSKAISAAGGITIPSGARVYWVDSNGFHSALIEPVPGKGLCVSGVFWVVTVVLR